MDEHLIERIKQGDVEAFEQVYKAYYELLCHFALHLIHNLAIAEEVVDDVLFYLWDHRTEIDIVSLKGYLLRAVRNQSINAVRSKSYRQEAHETEISSAEAHEFIGTLFDDSHPLERLLLQEMEEKLREAIEQLPEECRRVFKMSRMEDKKYAEIASELGISVNTVKYHMKNAVKTLSVIMGRYLILLLMIRN